MIKIIGEQCGEAVVPPEIEPFASRFAGLRRGSCAKIGYTVETSLKVIRAPVIGEISVRLFTQAAEAVAGAGEGGTDFEV